MNDPIERDTNPVQSPGEPNVLALLKRIEYRLDALEQKVDTLIHQASERPFKERHFKKPFRPYGNSHRPADGNRDFNPRGERSFPPKRHFDKPQGENRGYGPRRDENRGFGPRSGEHRGFGPRRKKF